MSHSANNTNIPDFFNTSDGKEYSYEQAGYTKLKETKDYPLTSYHWLPEEIHTINKNENRGKHFWGENVHNILHNRQQFIKTVPRIRIVSMYPETALGSLGKVLDALFKLGETIAKAASEGNFKETGKKIFDLFKPAEHALGTLLYGSPTSGTPDIALAFPQYVYANLIGGIYTNSFEIPLLHGSDSAYLTNASAGNGWNRGSIWASLPGGDLLQSFAEALVPEVGLMGRPTYKPTGGEGEGQSFSVEFPLFNSNIEMLNDNFEFITKLTGETMWFQSGLLQRGSNLFDVHAEGKFHYHFCTCDITIDFVGKSRTLGAATQRITGTLKTFIDKHKNNNSQRFTFPDAYNVKLDFKSLAPVNFNTFMSYMANNGFKNGNLQGTPGAQSLSAFTQMLRNVVHAINCTLDGKDPDGWEC